MSAKTILILCAQAFFLKNAHSQCTSRAAVDASGFASPYSWAAPAASYNAYAYDGLAWAGRPCDGVYQALDFVPTSGGGLPITSISPISPTGISVISDNAYEGPVAVIGELPFLSAVAIEGVLPTAGAGAINHACGNGVTAMISEGIAPAYGPAAYGPAAYGPAAYSQGYGPAALASGIYGCGCGRVMY